MSEPEQLAAPVIDPPRAIRVRTSTGWADLVIKGKDGVGVPAGGTPGQLLTKDTASDYSTKWSPAPVALPPGGAVGQSLTKKSATDGDAQWSTLDNLHYLGDYAAGNFVEGDVVVYNGVAYVCVVPTNQAPTAWPGAPPVVQPPNTVTGYGTTLPSNPYDGQEYVLVDSVTAATYQWRFRFNAGRTQDANKWEFVGGTVVEVTDSADWAVPGGWASTTPTFTVPRAGVYSATSYLDWATVGGAAVVVWGSAGGTGGAWNGASHILPANSNDGVPPARTIAQPCAAGDTIRFWTYGGTTGATAKRRVLVIEPRRVA